MDSSAREKAVEEQTIQGKRQVVKTQNSLLCYRIYF